MSGTLDGGGFGEQLVLKLVDGRTGEVKRHLVVSGGVCYDLSSVDNLLLELRKSEEYLRSLIIRK